jgi:hypothetical protein
MPTFNSSISLFIFHALYDSLFFCSSNHSKLENELPLLSLYQNGFVSFAPLISSIRYTKHSENNLLGEAYDGVRGGTKVRFVSAIEGM